MDRPQDRRRTDAEERPKTPEDVAAAHPTKDEDQDKDERDDAIDEASADSFPSSDPPAW